MADDGTSGIPSNEDLGRLKTAAEISEKLNKLSDAQLETLNKRADLNEKIKGHVESTLENKKKTLDYATSELKKLEAMRKVYGDLQHTADGRALAAEQDLKIAESLLTIAKERQRTEGESADAYTKRIKGLEKEVAVAKIAAERASEFLYSIEESVDAAKRMGSAIGSAGQIFESNFVSKAGEFLKIFSNGMTAPMEMVRQMGSSITTSFINNMAGLAFQIVDAEAAFRKATGASAEFAKSTTEVYKATREAGVSIAEASAATQALHTTFTDFTMIGKANREMLAGTAAVLGELGVANDDFAKGVQISTKALGMSTEAAEHTQRELATFAQDLGVAPQKMAADFAQAGDTMAKMGDQGVDAFKGLAHAAKITGMSIDKLLSITNKFDTFEGAAEQAGKLNAALGGNMVNAMDLMMTTDPTERFSMLRDSILDAGLSFDEMSYYQKNFYKDALGLQDVGDLAMMLSGNMDDLGGASQKSSKDLIELKEAARSVQSIQEQLNATLAAAMPILEPLIENIQSLLGFLAEYPDETKRVVQGIVLLTVAAKAWTLVSGLASAASALWASVMGTTAAAQASAAAAAAAAAAVQGPALTGLAKATGSAGRTMISAVPAFLGIGLAILGIGGGIYLAATGMGNFVTAFKGLELQNLLAIGLGLLMMAGAMTVLSLSLIAFGAAAISAGPALLGLGIIAMQFKGIAEAINEIPETKVVALAVTMDSMVKLAEMDGLKGKMEQVSEVIAQINHTVLGRTAAPTAAAAAFTQENRQSPPTKTPHPIIRQPINITLDDKVIGNTILEVVVGAARDANNQR